MLEIDQLSMMRKDSHIPEEEHDIGEQNTPQELRVDLAQG